MTYLLDTNVISEWVKPRPNPNVVRWLDRVRAQPGFLPQVYPYAIDPHSTAELP